MGEDRAIETILARQDALDQRIVALEALIQERIDAPQTIKIKVVSPKCD